MTINQRFGKFEFDTASTAHDDSLIIRHIPSGNTWSFSPDGTLQTDRVSHTADAGVITAFGGQSPANVVELSDVGISQTTPHQFTVYVDSDPAFDATYGWNYDYGYEWDNPNSTVDINLTINWDTDPGAGNDIDLRWELLEV